MMLALYNSMTTGQKLSVLIGVLSALSGGTAQLTPVFGSIVSHSIVSVANLIMAIFVTPVLFVVTGQKNIVQTVQAMPGIESIQVNSQANKTLATLAVDQAEAKVDIIPGANAAVTATAKG